MARTNSKGSTSARGGNLPFTGTMAPPFKTESRPESNPAMDAWQGAEQPLSSYTFSHQSPQNTRSNFLRRQNLEQVPELDNVGEDPAAWMARTGLVTPSVSLTLSPVVPSTRHMSINTQHDMFSMQLPPTPSSDSQSLTTATTLTGNTLSRQNSFYYNDLPGSIEMMHVMSQNSFSTDINDLHDEDHSYTEVAPHSISSHIRRSSDEEQTQLLAGLGGTSNDSQFSQSFSSTEALAQFQSSGFSGEPMEKSQSTDSTSSSSSSSSSRSKQRLQAQIASAASRLIKPKGGDGTAMSRDNSSQSMARVKSKDGQQEKIAIAKPTYQRPKHDRVYCKKCEDHTEGFRGEHELRRHEDRQHKTMVKKWVCITPSNLNDLPKPVVPLSKCKACTQHQKKYGAYYNAAAHLRRAHFRPKAKGRSKTKHGDEAAKRGGKGGGNWPSMEELKPWMKEVEERATDYTLTTAQQEEADASEDEVDIIDSSQPTNVNMYANNYDFSSNDIFGMQIPMQNLDFNSQPMSLLGQSGFPMFSNGSFGSSMHQSFDENLLGLSPVKFSYSG